MNIHNYLFLPHSYGDIDCASLISLYYKQELNIDLNLPEYPHSKSWMRVFSTDYLDNWAISNAHKICLTDAQNFDLISFKAKSSNALIHFGMYIKPNKMLHIEEGSTSRVDTLDDYWLSRLHAIYRHNELV
jgi:cell wall-associated NlpC family hydrolase